ncbi:hypothetical protein [Mycobacteroides abscessus]|uniref:hypothetical protein n=1 Tax=Mycobacteroides abscessus TaxID=36809 RepID=UPI0005E8EFE0|nr:hypothetical protein [Mycobacteroides abscessus]CPW94878.1 Uncharacterised protein [Mycobacteroides abscessus]SKU67041.1 Uncharacterised protein [Mycobacteroides abscessus subsp. abscessus]
MARSVVALDSTVFYTSIARIVEGDETPYTGYMHAEPVTASHHPAAEVRRHIDLAEQVVDALTSSRHGIPALVVLVKPQMGALAKDPSGHRRLGVHWELVRQLNAAEIPVGEVSLLSTQKACLGRAEWGKRGTDPLAQWVAEQWSSYTPPTRADKGRQVPDARYRVTTVALAAVAAIAAGFPLPQLPATDEVLVALRGGVSLPPEFGLPETRGAFDKKAKRLSGDAYVQERLTLIKTEPLEELKTWRTPHNREIRKALEARLGTNEELEMEKRMMGGDW